MMYEISVMKKLILLFLGAMMMASGYAANEAVIKGLKANNASYKNIVCDFDQVKHIKISDNAVETAGKLYYQGECMSMIYTKPDGEFFKITDTNINMVAGKVKINKKLSANSPFKMLRDLLIFSMKGDIKALETLTESTPEYKSGADVHEFTFASKGKAAKGYNKVVLKYSKKNNALIYMELHQPNGNYTTYTLKNLKFSVAIPNGVF